LEAQPPEVLLLQGLLPAVYWPILEALVAMAQTLSLAVLALAVPWELDQVLHLLVAVAGRAAATAVVAVVPAGHWVPATAAAEPLA
jgi:hypothetical protein